MRNRNNFLEQKCELLEVLPIEPKTPPPPPKYKIEGLNNSIIIVENGTKRELSPYEEIEGLNITINGDNNIIIIEKPYNFLNSTIKISNNKNASLFIGKNSRLYDFHLLVWDGDSQTLNFGIDMLCNGLTFITRGEKNTIIIGNDCIFADEVFIRLDDGHSIIDTNTGKILNHTPKSFSIGNHCWLCKGVKVTKNAQIPNNTIVGMGSVVTKKFINEGTIIAGNPAKVVRENVTWDRKHPLILEKDRNSSEEVFFL